MWNVYIYKKPDTLQKGRQLLLRFYIKNARHSTLRYFSWNFWTRYLYKYKSMTLCVTRRFYIQRARHFAKSEKICLTFLCTKCRTLCVTRFFTEFMKLAEGGGGLYAKNSALCVTFLYAKTMHSALDLYIQKDRHFALHFNIQKKPALCVTFYIESFII